MKYLKPLDDWLGKNPLPRNAMTDSSAIHLGVTLGLANISREQAMQIAQCSSMYFAIIKHDLKNTRAIIAKVRVEVLYLALILTFLNKTEFKVR